MTQEIVLEAGRVGAKVLRPVFKKLDEDQCGKSEVSIQEHRARAAGEGAGSRSCRVLLQSKYSGSYGRVLMKPREG